MVFPVDTMPNLLTAELQAVAESTPPIPLTIRRTEVVRDAVGGGTHVFLVPDEGRVEIEALHNRLYAGVLQPHLLVMWGTYGMSVCQCPFAPCAACSRRPDTATLHRPRQPA
jgi:hypothetical protein